MDLPEKITSFGQFVELHQAIETALQAARKAGDIAEFNNLVGLRDILEERCPAFFQKMLETVPSEFIEESAAAGIRAMSSLSHLTLRKDVLVGALAVGTVLVGGYVLLRALSKLPPQRNIVLRRRHRSNNVMAMKTA